MIYGTGCKSAYPMFKTPSICLVYACFLGSKKPYPLARELLSGKSLPSSNECCGELSWL